MSNDNKFWGIVVYDILEHGCLNGIWTNTANNGAISNEMAKQIENKDNEDRLIGSYQVSWIEPKDCKSHSCKLNITKENSLYTLTWGDDFIGEGFKMNNKLVVTYWKTK